MIPRTIPRKLTVACGIAAMTLAVSLPAWRASAQPPALRKPAASGMVMDRVPSPIPQPPPGEAMHDMPGVPEKRVFTVTGNEDWNALRGFGNDSSMIRMMTLMMVGGSGMEHMRMRAMKPGRMTMGDVPTASDSHASPVMPLAMAITPNPPVVGDNKLDIAVTDTSGKPVTGLKLDASVAMTSMDMGTTKPKITESPSGHYVTVVNFSMKGPWRVTVHVVPPNQAPFVRAFDFNVTR